MAESKHYFAFFSFLAFAGIAIFSVMGMLSDNAFKDRTQFPSQEFYLVIMLETFGYVAVFLGLVVYLITKIPGIGCVLEQLPCTTLLKFIATMGSLAWSVGTYYLYKFYKENEIRELYNTSSMLGTLAYTQLLFPLCYAMTCVIAACLSCYCRKKKNKSSSYNEI